MKDITLVKIDSKGYLKVGNKFLRIPNNIKVFKRKKYNNYELYYSGAYSLYRKCTTFKHFIFNYLKFIEEITDEESLFDTQVRIKRISKVNYYKGVALPRFTKIKKAASGKMCLIYQDPFNKNYRSVTITDEGTVPFKDSVALKTVKAIFDKDFAKISETYLSLEDIKENILSDVLEYEHVRTIV